MIACIHTHVTLFDAKSEINSNIDKKILSSIVN